MITWNGRERHQDGNPMLGMFVGVLLSLPFWVVLAAIWIACH